ncbi:MAG: hypothetical protein P8163_08210 [Candidatus Thiodiazotropha sp.]
MFTAKSFSTLLLLLIIVGVACWSKLRFTDPENHQEQRWRIDQYQGFKQSNQQMLQPTLNGQKSDKYNP